MTEPRLKTLLDDLAAEAPPGRSIRTKPLREQIRRRRSRRTIATGAAVLSAVAVVSGGAVVGAQWINQPAADDSQHRFVIGACGERVVDAGELTGPLLLSADFPTEVRLPGPGVLEGTVTFTNVGDRAFDGGRGRYPDTFLAKDGVVVAGPLEIRAIGIPMSLTPGQSDTLTAYVSLQRCPRGPSTPWEQRVANLEPGTYELYAHESVVPEGHRGPEDFIEVYGGPWEITLR